MTDRTLQLLGAEPLTGSDPNGVPVVVDTSDGLDTLRKADVVIVPSWSNAEAPAPRALADALRQAHAKGKLIVGLCLGAFVLGDAGLLDDGQATTHWIARDVFAKRFPRTQFRPDVLYVADGNVITSAGTVAAIDCCLHLVRQRHGADVANRTAQMLVTPPHRQGGQPQYIEQPVPQLPSENRDCLAYWNGRASTLPSPCRSICTPKWRA